MSSPSRSKSKHLKSKNGKSTHAITLKNRVDAFGTAGKNTKRNPIIRSKKSLSILSKNTQVSIACNRHLLKAAKNTLKFLLAVASELFCTPYNSLHPASIAGRTAELRS
ncbi:hypothetical protein [Microcoleus sp.]|uniref:hypothetical protein n=1 Tax=Microcoleus sp. TaxID=44472 RepID=UPI003594568C